MLDQGRADDRFPVHPECVVGELARDRQAVKGSAQDVAETQRAVGAGTVHFFPARVAQLTRIT